LNEEFKIIIIIIIIAEHWIFIEGIELNDLK
jgi:hypothetical protein